MTNIANLPNELASDIQFYIATNADFRTTFQVTDDQTGAPIDITGIDFYADLKLTAGGSDVLLRMSTKNGSIVTDPQLGTLTFAVPRSKPASGANMNHTSLLPPGTAVIDIIASDGLILKSLCEKGGPATVTITQGITNVTLSSS